MLHRLWRPGNALVQTTLKIKMVWGAGVANGERCGVDVQL